MNQITTQYVTEGGACFEQYVITRPRGKNCPDHHPPSAAAWSPALPWTATSTSGPAAPTSASATAPRFGIPVLFPNCGKPDNGVHIFNGQAYPMEIHGMADLCPWEVESVGPDGVTLILESSPLTKFLYPFDFTVLMNYNLQGNTASLSMTVINEGDVPMPFSFGYHPYFVASALENVDFDIKCATCSEDCQGRAACRTREDHPDPQGRF